MCVAEYNEDICLPQGSRGIRGPQGAVGKKGDNVREKGEKKEKRTQVVFGGGAKSGPLIRLPVVPGSAWD